jgi:hypothetical protein
MQEGARLVAACRVSTQMRLACCCWFYCWSVHPTIKQSQLLLLLLLLLLPAACAGWR